MRSSFSFSSSLPPLDESDKFLGLEMVPAAVFEVLLDLEPELNRGKMELGFCILTGLDPGFSTGFGITNGLDPGFCGLDPGFGITDGLDTVFGSGLGPILEEAVSWDEGSRISKRLRLVPIPMYLGALEIGSMGT